MVTTVFNFHNLKKWVACADCGTYLNDQWVQQWDQHPSVFQAGATILNRLNFLADTVFNFHNLKKWVACTNCSAILNRSNFMVTTVFNFHNLKKWVACTD